MTHLSDAVLLRDLAGLIVQDRVTTATLLAHIAEVDARRLYATAGHPSMHAYCVDELRLSEGAAYKRIRAARAAREFPALFAAVAEGRLHLSAVCLLAPLVTPENLEELMGAATHRRKSEVEAFLARRFPSEAPADATRTVPAATLRPIPAPAPMQATPSTQLGDLLSPGTVEDEHPNSGCRDLAPGTVDTQSQDEELSPGTVASDCPPPTASERFLLKLVMDKDLHDKLRYAQTLLSHAVPSGDIAQVLGRALDALIPQLEKRKFGATSRQPRRQEPPVSQHQERRPRMPLPRSTSRPSYIPAPVRRAVWERDQGQCTFVGANGHRCKTRSSSSSITSTRWPAEGRGQSMGCGYGVERTINMKRSACSEPDS